MSNKVALSKISTSSTPTSVYTSPSNVATLDAIKVVANGTTTLGNIQVEIVRGGNPFTYIWILVSTNNPSTTIYYDTFNPVPQFNFQTGDVVRITTHQSIPYDFFIYVTE